MVVKVTLKSKSSFFRAKIETFLRREQKRMLFLGRLPRWRSPLPLSLPLPQPLPTPTQSRRRRSATSNKTHLERETRRRSGIFHREVDSWSDESMLQSITTLVSDWSQSCSIVTSSHCRIIARSKRHSTGTTKMGNCCSPTRQEIKVSQWCFKHLCTQKQLAYN